MPVPIKTPFCKRNLLNFFALLPETGGNLPNLFDLAGVQAAVDILGLPNAGLVALAATVMPQVETVHHFLLAHVHALPELVGVRDALNRRPHAHQHQQRDPTWAEHNYIVYMAHLSDVEHALLSFASTFHPYARAPLTRMAQFSSGMVFAHMLATV